MNKIKFPKDEKKHNSVIEWWYFNGILKDEKNRTYSFMNTLFNAKTSKVDIKIYNHTAPKRVYFSHSILTDISKKRKYHEVIPIVFVDKNSFKEKDLNISYSSPMYRTYVIKKLDNNIYRIKNSHIDLILKARKKPLLVDDGFLKLPKKTTYYYSITNFDAQGYIYERGKAIHVEGKAWHDHQWSNYGNSDDEWEWFSIQLDDDREILCFNYRNKNSKKVITKGYFVDDKNKKIKDIVISPTKHYWKSKQTDSKYCTKYFISSKKMNLFLECNAINKNQEIIFGEISYWEGPISVKGTIDNKKVKGNGFMELVGAKLNYKNILSIITKKIRL